MLRRSLNRFLKINLTSFRKISTNEIIDEEIPQVQIQNEEINEKLINKSKLKPREYNLVHNQLYQDEFYKSLPLKTRVSLYGKFGSHSDFNEAQCWPSREELKEKIEYENIVNPHSFQELKNQFEQAHKEKEIRLKERKEEILLKMEKLEEWKTNLLMNIQKKAEAAESARVTKERLIEEVRRETGYKIDLRDERFKELLEKKQRIEKKLLKEEKMKSKEAKLKDKIINKIESTEIIS